MKICKTCGIQKPLDSFSKAKIARGERALRGGKGVVSNCKHCVAEKRSPGIHARKEAEVLERTSLYAKGLKRCSKCQEVKVLSDFCVRKASPDGLNLKCRDCSKSYLEGWRGENPDSFKKYYAERKDELNANFKTWRVENAESRAGYMAQWLKENRALSNEKAMRRVASKRQATPKWANRERMVEFYKEAERLTAQTGIPHNVDHIYPLQGKTVCGLHCEANLNVITQFENIQKLNRMPTEEYLQRCER